MGIIIDATVNNASDDKVCLIYSNANRHVIDIFLKRVYDEQQNAVEQESSANNQENLDELVYSWPTESF